MAFRSIRVSDISGKEGKDTDFLTLVVRNHPAIEEPVQIDVLPNEIETLKGAEDLVEVEIKNGGGEPKRLIVPLAEFNAIAPNIEKVLADADGIRGRRRGFRPGQSVA